MTASVAETLQGWLAGATGGEVLAWTPLGSGNSRSTFVAEVELDGGVRELVIRYDVGGGPVSGTALSLEREAVLYRALEGRGLPIPHLWAASEQLGAIATERMSGEPAESQAVLPELLERLAALHRLELQELPLPGFARSAAGDLELWESIAEQKLPAGEPLVSLAFAILRERFPGEPERLVLCHGDYGEGNFLVRDGHVSALLDWEFSHLGDPHDDLAWITVRALMFGHALDDFDAAVRAHYAPGAAAALSPERLRYWQAVVVLRNLICCLSVVRAPQERDRSVHLMLVPGLAARLVRMLAGLCGVEHDPAVGAGEEFGDVAVPFPGDELLREVVSGLRELGSTIVDAEARRRARRLGRMVGQFAETWHLAAAVAAANEHDRTEAGSDRASQLHRFGRIAERELALLPRASPIAGGPLAGLEG